MSVASETPVEPFLHAPPRPTLVSRAPQRHFRSLSAWWIATRVIASYLWMQLTTRYRSEENAAAHRRRTHRKNAQRVHVLIARLQGIYIKVGQFISIMTNFLPTEYVEELAGLQDQVPPRPYADIERRLREEYGKDPKEIFAQLDERPIAAASIGQVHRAKLPSGEAVAVKVQYPDIESIVAHDLSTMRGILRLVGWIFFHPILDSIYQEVRQMVMAELDFRKEAHNLETIAAEFADDPEVGVPMLHRNLSTGRVLCTSWVEGIKSTDRARLREANIDAPALARRIVKAYCQQIFHHGTYHADPHPGNLIVQPHADGTFRLVFIDFGAVAELGPTMRHGIAEVVQAAVTRDTEKLNRAMKQMGFIAKGADSVVFDKVIDYLHQRFQEQVQVESFSLSAIKIDLQQKKQTIADLSRMNLSLRDLGEHFYIPKEWILLERTLLLLTGLCTELSPALNPFEIIRPYAEELVLGKEGDYAALVVDATKTLTTTVLALPAELRKAMAKLQHGEIEMQVGGLAEAGELIYAVGQQLVLTMIGIASAAVAMVYEGRSDLDASRLAWGITIGCATLLAWRMLAARRPTKKKR